MANLLQVHPNERVDIRDFAFAVQESFVGDDELFARALFGTTLGQVLSGFFFTINSATELQIDLGGLLGSRVTDGVQNNGHLLSEGATSRVIDFSGLGAGQYGIYVRFRYAEGEAQNRVFWDPTNDVEVAQLVNSRLVPDWDIQEALTSPGPEWVQLWLVVWDGADLNTSTQLDFRELLWETTTPGILGSTYAAGGVLAVNNYGIDESQWGAGVDDRNPDRGQFAIQDLYTWVKKTDQKIIEIQNGTNPLTTSERWWDTPIHGSLDDMLPLEGSVDAARRMRGSILPDTDITHDLGSSSLQWQDLYSQSVLTDFVQSDAVQIIGSATGLTTAGTTVNSLDGDWTFESGSTLDFDSATDMTFPNFGGINMTGNNLLVVSGSAEAIIDKLDTHSPRTPGTDTIGTGIADQYLAGYFDTLIANSNIQTLAYIHPSSNYTRRQSIVGRLTGVIPVASTGFVSATFAGASDLTPASNADQWSRFSFDTGVSGTLQRIDIYGAPLLAIVTQWDVQVRDRDDTLLHSYNFSTNATTLQLWDSETAIAQALSSNQHCTVQIQAYDFGNANTFVIHDVVIDVDYLSLNNMFGF